VRNHVSDCIRHESSQYELSKFGMIISLMEEDSLFSKHPLFTRRKSRFKQMRLCNQYEFRCFRARDHHTWTSQYMSLEHRSVSVLSKPVIKKKKSTFLFLRQQSLNFEDFQEETLFLDLFCFAAKNTLGSCE